MKTRKKSLIALALFAIVGTSTYTGYSAYQRATMTDAQRLTLENIEALTLDRDNGVITIPAIDQRDNPRSCKTSKMISVDLGNGNFSYREVSVTGLQNACRREVGSTCTAYACYAQ